MAVYKRGYQRYSGTRTSHLMRLLAYPRFAWRRLFRERLVVVALLASLIWPLLCMVFIYVSNRMDLWPGLGKELLQYLSVNGKFFLVFMNVQAVAVVILAALAGPGLVAPDLSNNALPLYLSRPFTRVDYVFSRLVVLLGLLALVSWIPALVLLAMQTGMAGWGWLAANWGLAAGTLGGMAVWTILVSLVALACSAYVRWRVLAGALLLGVFFLLSGAAEIIRRILEAPWLNLISPAGAMYQLWCAWLGVEPPEGPSPHASALALIAMGALVIFVLERKLRPVEVVS